jgi:hypothetical protein
MNLSVDPPTSTTINTDEEEVKLPGISFGYHCGRGQKEQNNGGIVVADSMEHVSLFPVL